MPKIICSVIVLPLLSTLGKNNSTQANLLYSHCNCRFLSHFKCLSLAKIGTMPKFCSKNFQHFSIFQRTYKKKKKTGKHCTFLHWTNFIELSICIIQQWIFTHPCWIAEQSRCVKKHTNPLSTQTSIYF